MIRKVHHKNTNTREVYEFPCLFSALYQVNSLGIKFSIPEYNSSLHERAHMSPRPATSQTSIDVTSSVTRPVTHSFASRSQIGTQNGARDNKNGVPRGFGGIQRSYTFAPKLFSSEAPSTAPDAQIKQTKSDSKTVDLTIERQKTRFSLPPIGLALKTKSLTISHF